jgi:hypothetical protein
MNTSAKIGARPSRLCGARASRRRFIIQFWTGETPVGHTAGTAVLR